MFLNKILYSLFLLLSKTLNPCKTVCSGEHCCGQLARSLGSQSWENGLGRRAGSLLHPCPWHDDGDGNSRMMIMTVMGVAWFVVFGSIFAGFCPCWGWVQLSLSLAAEEDNKQARRKGGKSNRWERPKRGSSGEEGKNVRWWYIALERCCWWWDLLSHRQVCKSHAHQPTCLSLTGSFGVYPSSRTAAVAVAAAASPLRVWVHLEEEWSWHGEGIRNGYARSYRL